METSHCQPTLLTLHDAVTDSPVYRANVLHFDEQLDLLEKWLDQLSRHLKQYTDKLAKFNMETNNVCKKAIPVGIDSVLIDPNFTGAVIRSFSDALQTSLAFKTKLVSDLEDNFIQPLTQFVKTNLKEFREFRKQHEKALERYEAQLYKYTSQSKTKEPSAVREEAFRLHEARKAYTRMSGQHVVRMLQFRSMLEHCLVESFSSAMMAHFQDVDAEKQVWSKLDAGLNAWKQWLIDDRKTCDYQLHRLQVARKQLQSEHVQQTQPLRDLDRYGSVTLPSSIGTAMASRHSLDFSNIVPNDEATATSAHKWGYLFTRVSRMSWARKWFFLYDGYFGTCQVNTNPKMKGAITVGERVSVLLCDIKPMADQDRRFCFEVVCVQQGPFILQAETEQEMRDWIASFAKAKRFMLENEQLHLHTNPPANASSTTTITTTAVATTSDHEGHSSSESDSPRRSRNSMPVLRNATDSALSLPATAPSSRTTTATPSAVMLSTSADNQDQVSLTTSTTLTPLLVHEAVKAQQPPSNASSSPPTSPATPSQSFAAAMTSSVSQQQAQQHQQQQQQQQQQSNGGAGTWGIPWGLVPNMFSGSSGAADDEMPTTPMSPTAASSLLNSGVDSDGHPIIWPLRPADDATTTKVALTGYSPELESRNRELRVLFGGVSSKEVVLDAFIGALKKKPVDEEQGDSSNDDVASPVTPTGFVDPLEQELSAQLSGSVQRPQSAFGYSYTGRAFITQETFWYYSCVLMSCVNTVAIPLKGIKTVRLIRDNSVADGVAKNGKANNLALAIDLAEGDEPLVLMTLLDDVEVVAERLRFAVENAKSSEPMLLQTLYDVLHSMSASLNKSQTTQVIQQKKAEPTVSQSMPDMTTAEIYQPEPPIASPVPESKRKRKARKSSGANKPVPKSGALAAAMMAATVAGGSGFFDASKMVNIEDAAQKRSSIGNRKMTAESSESLSSNAAAHQSTSTIVATPPAIDQIRQEKGSGDDSSSSAQAKTTEEEIPSHIQVPTEPCVCDCGDHLDKVESEIQLPISAKRLYDLLFDSQDISIWEAKNNAGGGTNLRVGVWDTVDGKSQRVMKYILPVSNPMVKVKEAEVVETQVILKKEDYIRYVVQISTKTAQLPYADAFIPSVKYCISWVSKTQCKLTCSMGVKFVKSVLVKGMISKAALKGMGESIVSFVPILEEKVAELNGSKSVDQSLLRNATLSRQSRVSSKASPRKSTTDTTVSTTSSSISAASSSSSSFDYMGWIDTVSETVSSIPFTIRASLMGLLVLWIMWSWLFRSSSSTKHEDPFPALLPPPPGRAVYLRDLEDGLLKTELQPSYIDSESFQLFLATRPLNGTTNHQWYNAKHRRMAIELLFSRERVGMLRHDMLVIFQMLNQVDAQLLENEYINWLLDTRLLCRSSNEPCEHVNVQLKSFFG
ncbi:hypothetical protein BDB00DRAFT_818072 [Zychaea mexicana]|uniref:uncharacterized protein n=1 Tax=Zychaea mexicana TaxID=64656 RepID=UPI0022FE9238|nr:uncharacterized protein BDB00DRAFT_818072 [Zychaea mexicana]KAI9494450.1 hypothetical protein BDB00DRAFT_818072 [Zychaea mexicana]